MVFITDDFIINGVRFSIRARWDRGCIGLAVESVLLPVSCNDDGDRDQCTYADNKEKVHLSGNINQDNPSISPSTMVIRSACGLFGRPGIRSISPAMATIISLPQLRMMSRMRMVNPSGEP